MSSTPRLSISPSGPLGEHIPSWLLHTVSHVRLVAAACNAPVPDTPPCCAVFRTGQIYVNGSVNTVTLAAGGTSSVYILGLEESANVNLGGTAAAVIGVLNGATL